MFFVLGFASLVFDLMLSFEYVKHMVKKEKPDESICRNLIFIPIPLLFLSYSPICNHFCKFLINHSSIFSFKNRCTCMCILFSYSKCNIYTLFSTSFFFFFFTLFWRVLHIGTHNSWYIQIFLILFYGGIIFSCVDIILLMSLDLMYICI